VAFQGNRPKTPQGASISDPTRASKPHPETYKAPRLDKGGVVLDAKVDENGIPLAASGYGRNQATIPSSIDVKQAGGDRGRGLSDFDISPPDGDPTLALIAGQGWGDRSDSGKPIDDLQRKIDTTAYPTTWGMERRGSGGSPSSTVPKTTGGGNAGDFDARRQAGVKRTT